MVAEVGSVILNLKGIPLGTQKMGAPHPFSSKNISLKMTILGCVKMDVRVCDVCDCHEQLLAWSWHL